MAQLIGAQLSGFGSCVKTINSTGQWCIGTLQSDLSNSCRQITKDIQHLIDTKTKDGDVNFTKKATFFNFKKINELERENEIIIRGQQAAYLRSVLTDDAQAFNKIVPTSSAKLDKYGNIQGLHRNLASGKFKIIDSGGKRLLIDTTKKGKNRDKRVIGVYEDNQTRNELFDFYQECQKLGDEAIKDIKGSFKMEIKE